MKDWFKVVGAATMIFVAVLLAPLLSIWAWNVLFGPLYTIPYTLETWFAASVLFSAVRLQK
jgi:hypothetical protein